jgi:hypothetical protein
VTEPGYPPRPPVHSGRSGRSRSPQEPRKTGWQTLEAFDERADSETDLPPWAVPGGIEPVRPGRRPARAPERPEFSKTGPAEPSGQDAPPRRGRMASRAAAARRRRSKRRLLTWGSAALVVVVVAAGGFLVFRSNAPKSKFVTVLQRGEVRSVPSACKVVGAASLHQYLAGQPTSTVPYSAAAQSQCTYTVDAKPVFRVMSLTAQAYLPNLTVPGNGSATATARYTFAQQRRLLIKPPKNTPQPPAAISSLGGLGDQAFTAVQVFKGSSVSDRETVVARYRNVIITVYLQALASGGFGPVVASDLRAGAVAAARDLMAKVRAEPTVG